MKKAAQLHLVKNAPSNSVLAAKARAGKDKVGAGRKEVPHAGYGINLVEAWRGSESTVMDALRDYASQNQATMLLAIEEVKEARTADQDSLGQLRNELVKRKHHAIASNYSRMIRVMSALQKGKSDNPPKGLNVAAILDCNNIAQAASCIAPRKATGAEPKPFTESNVSNWLGKAKRILPLDMVRKGQSKAASDAEKVKLMEGVASLEKAFGEILAQLARPAVAELSHLPVSQIVALSKGKQAKAA